MIQSIYLDNNACTPLHPRLREKWSEALELWGNPSSVHWAGRRGKEILRETRRRLAAHLGVSPLEIIFNSGASEGNSQVFWHWMSIPPENRRRNKILISSVEHSSIQKAALEAESRGYEVFRIPVRRGLGLDMEFVERHLDERTALVAVMWVQNETGEIFPLQELTSRAHRVGAWVHTDAVQALGKTPMDLQSIGVDSASFSGQKVYALKGSGFLYWKKTQPNFKFIFGQQERARRGGTENLMGVWSLGEVFQGFEVEMIEARERVEALRDLLEQKLLREIPGVQITASDRPRVGNVSSLIVPGVDGESLLMALDLRGIAVSTGAACTSGSSEPSPVLQAMGLSLAEANSSLRVSLGWFSQLSEIEIFVDSLREVVERLRRVQEVNIG